MISITSIIVKRQCLLFFQQHKGPPLEYHRCRLNYQHCGQQICRLPKHHQLQHESLRRILRLILHPHLPHHQLNFPVIRLLTVHQSAHLTHHRIILQCFRHLCPAEILLLNHHFNQRILLVTSPLMYHLKVRNLQIFLH